MADSNDRRHGKKQVVLLMEPALYDLASSVCELEGMSMSAMVRQAIQVWCLRSSDNWRLELEKFDAIAQARIDAGADSALASPARDRAVKARATARRLLSGTSPARRPRKR